MEISCYSFQTHAGVPALIKSLRTAMQNIFTRTINRLNWESYREPENQALQ